MLVQFVMPQCSKMRSVLQKLREYAVHQPERTVFVQASTEQRNQPEATRLHGGQTPVEARGTFSHAMMQALPYVWPSAPHTGLYVLLHLQKPSGSVPAGRSKNSRPPATALLCTTDVAERDYATAHYMTDRGSAQAFPRIAARITSSPTWKHRRTWSGCCGSNRGDAHRRLLQTCREPVQGEDQQNRPHRAKPVSGREVSKIDWPESRKGSDSALEALARGPELE